MAAATPEKKRQGVKTTTTTSERNWKAETHETIKSIIEISSDEDKDKNFLIPRLKKLEIVEAEMTGKTTTRIVYRFPVSREYLNPTRTFHGGAISAISEVCTTWTLFPISDYGLWSTMGTMRSLTLTCIYVKPAVEGEMVRVECRIVHAVRRLCPLTGIMRQENDGQVVATCEHNKYNIDIEESKM